jgi:hypothetical protein
VRVGPDGERQIDMLTWGMPMPPDRMKGKADYGTTNIRHPTFAHWQQYLGVENHCVVPATSFAELSPTPNDKDPEIGIQRNFWFALDESKPASGLWTPWHRIRTVKDGPMHHAHYGFFTTNPNALVLADTPQGHAGPDHAGGDGCLATAPWSEAKVLQRPCPTISSSSSINPAQIKFPAAQSQGALF